MGDATEMWTDLAIGLYDRLYDRRTGRKAEITHDFDPLQVDVPSRTGADADRRGAPRAPPQRGGHRTTPRLSASKSRLI